MFTEYRIKQMHKDGANAMNQIWMIEYKTAKQRKFRTHYGGWNTLAAAEAAVARYRAEDQERALLAAKKAVLSDKEFAKQLANYFA